MLNAQSTWREKPTGEMFELKAVDFITENEGIVVGMMGLIMKTTDGADTWTKIDMGFTGNFNTVQYIDADRVIIGGDQGIILYSADGGDNWDIVQESGQEYNILGINVNADSGKGIAGGSGNTILWSDDFGQSWTYVSGGLINNYYCAYMADADFGVVIGRNAIFQPLAGYTFDGGQSWGSRDFYPTQNNTAHEGAVRDAYFFSSNDGFTAGTTMTGDGFITTGVNWDGQLWDATVFPLAPLYGLDFLDNLHGVAVGGDFLQTIYVFETSDGGLTWQQAEVISRGNAMLDVALVGNTGYAVGPFGELLKKDIETGIINKTVTPVKMYNYPNPCYDRTEIFLEAGHSDKINISLFDLNGKMIKTIFSGTIEAGSQTFTVSTAGLPAGVYQYTVAGTQMRSTQKLIVE